MLCSLVVPGGNWYVGSAAGALNSSGNWDRGSVGAARKIDICSI